MNNQLPADALCMNALKRRLDKLRQTREGFYGLIPISSRSHRSTVSPVSQASRLHKVRYMYKARCYIENCDSKLKTNITENRCTSFNKLLDAGLGELWAVVKSTAGHCHSRPSCIDRDQINRFFANVSTNCTVKTTLTAIDKLLICS